MGKHPQSDTKRAQVKAEKWRSESPCVQPRLGAHPPQIMGGER